MMNESLFFDLRTETDENTAVLVEGLHEPDALAGASGIFISASGSAMFPCGKLTLLPLAQWAWFAVENGDAVLEANGEEIDLQGGECCMIPPDEGREIRLNLLQETRVLWFRLGGALAREFMVRMGAVPQRIMKQGALPTQINLVKHIVQATVRLRDIQEGSSAQLQQLLWAVLATHNGQPVAMDAVLSHEIAKVVDAMRRNQYRDNFSLAEMAAMSRMPVETFRKRFVSEVGMPPQRYQLFCKMERAKVLLKQGCTVRQSGIEVGMSDPYHFSKAFKNVVGLSPSAYCKTAARTHD